MQIDNYSNSLQCATTVSSVELNFTMWLTSEQQTQSNHNCISFSWTFSIIWFEMLLWFHSSHQKYTFDFEIENVMFLHRFNRYSVQCSAVLWTFYGFQQKTTIHQMQFNSIAYLSDKIRKVHENCIFARWTFQILRSKRVSHNFLLWGLFFLSRQRTG